MAVKDAIPNETAALVDFVKSAVLNTQAVGEQTTVIYDTAWVSMLRKPGLSHEEMLFPECFKFVLDQQMPHGGWITYDAPIDGIMNTLGALLALKRNSTISNLAIGNGELEARISKATRYLQQELDAWDVSTADHVGFEIVIPSILKLLEKEQIVFKFSKFSSFFRKGDFEFKK